MFLFFFLLEEDPRANHNPPKFPFCRLRLAVALPGFLPSCLPSWATSVFCFLQFFVYLHTHAACKIAQIIIKNQKADEQAQKLNSDEQRDDWREERK